MTVSTASGQFNKHTFTVDVFDGQLNIEFSSNSTSMPWAVSGLIIQCPNASGADFDNNCTVDVMDLAIFMKHWLGCGLYNTSRCFVEP